MSILNFYSNVWGRCISRLFSMGAFAKAHMIFVSVIFSILSLSACSTLEKIEAPITAKTFGDYQQQTMELVRKKRQFQFSDKDAELQWNSPREWRPGSLKANDKPNKGILLVHGLGDSPWSFHDVGQALAERGFLVRSVLLPGHGTTPYDMLDVTAEEWQRVVYEQAQSLSNDVNGEVYLGGFSTGANIVLDYAYKHTEIAGLVFFSPGFKSKAFDWLAPLASLVRTWLRTPAEGVPMQSPVRYMNVPTNGFNQYYRTSVNARNLLKKPYDKPVFMAVSEHDSVLDTHYLLDIFQRRFTHSKSRLIWYGTDPKDLTDHDRVLVRSDKLPSEHISQFSHMGVLFSPENELYGRNGTERICFNGMNRDDQKACENSSELWFSAWGYKEEGKVYARLTFNPYFDWQNNIMLQVIDSQNVELESQDLTTMNRL